MSQSKALDSKPLSENVNVDSEGSIELSSFFKNNLVDVIFSKRKSTYYSVTEPEIEVYAQFSWLATIFLTLFGISTGFALGCLTAIMQGNIPSDARATLMMSSIITGIVSAVFLIVSSVLIFLQARNKRTWKAS